VVFDRSKLKGSLGLGIWRLEDPGRDSSLGSERGSWMARLGRLALRADRIPCARLGPRTVEEDFKTLRARSLPRLAGYASK
jgi:hypothetical protein